MWNWQKKLRYESESRLQQMLKGSVLVQIPIDYFNTAEHCLRAQENTIAG